MASVKLLQCCFFFSFFTSFIFAVVERVDRKGFFIPFPVFFFVSLRGTEILLSLFFL